MNNGLFRCLVKADGRRTTARSTPIRQLSLQGPQNLGNRLGTAGPTTGLAGIQVGQAPMVHASD
jgi:hypothetical protein